MSDEANKQGSSSDGTADAVAALAMITIVIVAAVFWLSGL